MNNAGSIVCLESYDEAFEATALECARKVLPPESSPASIVSQPRSSLFEYDEIVETATKELAKRFSFGQQFTKTISDHLHDVRGRFLFADELAKTNRLVIITGPLVLETVKVLTIGAAQSKDKGDNFRNHFRFARANLIGRKPDLILCFGLDCLKPKWQKELKGMVTDPSIAHDLTLDPSETSESRVRVIQTQINRLVKQVQPGIV